MAKFRHLGRVLAADDDDSVDVAARMELAQGTVTRLRHNVLKPTCITTNTKVKVFQTVCTAQLVHGSESWWMSRQDENKLRSFQQRSLRHIVKMHPTVKENEEGEREIRMPAREAVLERAGVKDVVREVEHAQLRWYGHVLRMQPSSEVRKSYHSQLQAKEGQGSSTRTSWQCS